MEHHLERMDQFYIPMNFNLCRITHKPCLPLLPIAVGEVAGFRRMRSHTLLDLTAHYPRPDGLLVGDDETAAADGDACVLWCGRRGGRSEEHTSELQSRGQLVCRLLLEKK